MDLGNGAPGSGNSTFAGTTTPYGDYPTFINAIGNGVVYLVTSEHTITDPIYKGATLEDLNATTGQEILGTVLLDYTGEFEARASLSQTAIQQSLTGMTTKFTV